MINIGKYKYIYIQVNRQVNNNVSAKRHRNIIWFATLWRPQMAIWRFAHCLVAEPTLGVHGTDAYGCVCLKLGGPKRSNLEYLLIKHDKTWIKILVLLGEKNEPWKTSNLAACPPGASPAQPPRKLTLHKHKKCHKHNHDDSKRFSQLVLSSSSSSW